MSSKTDGKKIAHRRGTIVWGSEAFSCNGKVAKEVIDVVFRPPRDRPGEGSPFDPADWDLREIAWWLKANRPDLDITKYRDTSVRSFIKREAGTIASKNARKRAKKAKKSKTAHGGAEGAAAASAEWAPPPDLPVAPSQSSALPPPSDAFQTQALPSAFRSDNSRAARILNQNLVIQGLQQTLKLQQETKLDTAVIEGMITSELAKLQKMIEEEGEADNFASV
mmetsp:Transcript_33613/g.72754  ORF Transcript_33613/g.72754 Transcript_33613/m.72754 type:complete len:223 (+) Transcript_33613:80-748(+)